MLLGDENHCLCIGENRNAIRALMLQHEGKKPLARPRLDGIIIFKWILILMGGRGLD